VAGSGGRGNIMGNAIESSTVDIAREFTNLITLQRGYQANARVITTVDEMSQETINLKR
jgi:flagellar hook protein FlgE